MVSLLGAEDTQCLSSARCIKLWLLANFMLGCINPCSRQASYIMESRIIPNDLMLWKQREAPVLGTT